jgi:hypothetical protein
MNGHGETLGTTRLKQVKWNKDRVSKGYYKRLRRANFFPLDGHCHRKSARWRSRPTASLPMLIIKLTAQGERNYGIDRDNGTNKSC